LTSASSIQYILPFRAILVVQRHFAPKASMQHDQTTTSEPAIPQQIANAINRNHLASLVMVNQPSKVSKIMLDKPSFPPGIAGDSQSAIKSLENYGR